MAGIFQKVDEIKRPLIVGEKLLVPCLCKVNYNHKWNVFDVIPVINLPHSDIENGQYDIHYHVDYRFVDFNKKSGSKQKGYSKYINVIDPTGGRINKDTFGDIQYIVLPVKNKNHSLATAIELIQNSQLTHNCIHKGKCPHKGYDLSQEVSVNGIITCPLHGLKFDVSNNNVLTPDMLDLFFRREERPADELLLLPNDF